MRKFLIGVFFVIFMLGVFCACSREGKVNLEKEDKGFISGRRYYREGRYQEAMRAFLGVIESHRDAPESHFEVGRLYLDHFKDPIAAIYHFRKYLEIKPNVDQSPMVRQMIDRAKKNFAQTLPCRAIDDEISRLDLMDLLKKTQEENLKLQRQLVALQAGNSMSVSNVKTKGVEGPSFAPVKKVVVDSNKARSYTVASGDTLVKISNQMYGSSAYWELIYKANSESLKTPHDLRVGQMLRIPAKAK